MAHYFGGCVCLRKADWEMMYSQCEDYNRYCIYIPLLMVVEFGFVVSVRSGQVFSKLSDIL